VIGSALRDAGVDPGDVEHVNAHGTATPQNDAAESKGISRVFGDRTARVPVTSVKSMLGHLLGAAGAVEAAVLALTLRRGIIPPTIHHSETDAECRIDVVANAAREARLRCGVSTSLGFGGNDAVIVMRTI
jgi:3-oxoacyl-[acyl-carrier-protein] synthase II